MNFNFLKHRKIFYIISIATVVISLASILAWGFKSGIDFAGGTRWQVDFVSQKPDHEVLNQVLVTSGVNDAIIDYSNGNNVIMRFKSITEKEHQDLFTALQAKFGKVEDKNFSSIGPTIGAQLKTRAIWAVVIVILAILLYISYAFRKISIRIPSYKYGALAVLGLMHDAIVMLGLFSILGHFANIEINSYFIVAILIVMGYSVHDTIVVFDRIRENMKLLPAKTEIATVINHSINSTLARSINTSLTAILSLLGLYFFGPLAIKTLVLAMIVGIFVGTYSSIFIASPLLADWKQKA